MLASWIVCALKVHVGKVALTLEVRGQSQQVAIAGSKSETATATDSKRTETQPRRPHVMTSARLGRSERI
jgi:hypothetical protein